MSRSTRRASRALAIVLILTLAAGIFITAQKIKASRAGAASPLDKPQLLDQTPSQKLADTALRTDPPQQKEPTLQPLLSTTQTPTIQPIAEPIPQPVAVAFAAPPPAPTYTLTGNPLADGRARLDDADPIAARKILNDAFISGRLSEPDAAAAKTLLAKISQDVTFCRKAFKDDPTAAMYALQAGDELRKVAAANAITWELLCRVNSIANPKKVRAGQTLKLIKGPFHAVITKSRFTMDIYLGSPGEAGSIYVTTFPVGLGKDDSTPAGTWQVEPHKKLKKPTYYGPRGEGVIAAGDPKNPLGDFWIGISGIDGQAIGKTSYGIHGTIEPDSIGKEVSMGCIRMRNDDIALVFEMLVEGKSKVIVKD